jgi:pimeloyl-ACP methyl ester carboxylesterase
LICSTLGISKFSLLAHSAGAIYALATALRVPQHIRGKVHLLAPWIPPSQMEPVGMHQDSPPAAQLPRSQRFLRALPATFLKVANSSFLSATSASLSPNIGNGTQRKKRKSDNNQRAVSDTTSSTPNRRTQLRPESIMLMDSSKPSDSALAELARSPTNDVFPSTPTGSLFNKSIASAMAAPHTRSVSAPMMTPLSPTFPSLASLESPDARRKYDEALTAAIWEAATTGANPLVDLLVCLERTHSIGFRYVDITRSVVIHHGSKDTRVPVENVKWLGNAMRRCEVRVLDGEGHGLMASANVMGEVLQEMAKEWEEWSNLVSKGRMVA